MDSPSQLDTTLPDSSDDSQPILIKKLIRYALACEHARLPIRREGIREKVFGKHSGRRFQSIFDAAQDELIHVFGMMMVELPVKEKISLRDRRAQAQRGAGAGKTGSGAYILVSTLPERFRTPEIVVPSRAPTEAQEAAYMGLATFVVACIMLSNGSVSNEKLMRNLRRLNAEDHTPLDTTENLLARMVRQGYVVRVKDNSGGEEVVNWIVGPRGKVEIGRGVVKGLVEAVYGDGAPEDLESRLKVSLGVGADELEAQGQVDEDGDVEMMEIEEPRRSRRGQQG